MTIAVIVCAYNEERYISACLFSLKAQRRQPDEIIVINNASTDRTAIEAIGVPGVRVVDEPAKGLVNARQAARQYARADVPGFVEADCRALIWGGAILDGSNFHEYLEEIDHEARQAPIRSTSYPWRLGDADSPSQHERLAHRRAQHPRVHQCRSAGGRDSQPDPAAGR